ncbi:lipopolysaccharide biosynthesis protein [Ameyamaea chiangmaiensis NBRC 103196]|uniref:Capsule biosynthesis protein n=2 Tax=Ameyamaea chiangmaiensis TaxID=442969 RepID=A0A850PHJ8_9PROT|nr:capsule biosynthesis protein [Ameyamaea chiangmaiensis]NVN40651.1 capsule biosynthesis protein [Ameyamaea chiangmaiensis]GBQ63419.1 lipopolysaccharide biosynthesis protein [Ameyamaea chiangmaiensis NBRC 103196]
MLRWINNHRAFSGFVGVPTLLSAIYFAFFATPQYLSDAQFVVRGQTTQSGSMLAGLLQGGATGATEDTYAVQDYLMSRDAAALLIEKQNLKSVYDPPEADAIARFPNFYSGKTFEHFYAYYQRHVVAELDTTTGLSTLRVRTFSAAESQRIARALLAAAEELVNKMNARQRANTIEASLRELDDSTRRLSALNAKIDSYRNEIAMLDPTRQSQPVLHDIASLQSLLITTRVQLAQLERSTPGSPLIPVYMRRIDALNDEIAHTATNVTGSQDSLVPKISAYDELVFQRTLLEKEVATAASAVEAAKVQANRQTLYLDEVTQPNLPDYAAYPRGVADTAIVFATTLGLYLMVMLLIGGAKEHKLV